MNDLTCHNVGAGVLIRATAFFVIAALCSTTIAQDAAPAPEKKQLDIDVLIQTGPEYRIAAQDWGREFQKLGYSPRFRVPRVGEEMKVEDSKIGNKPIVHIVGGMLPDGCITIANREFSLNDLKPLAELLDEIAVHGPGGPPESNPSWGLDAAQITAITTTLAEPVAETVTLDSPVVTLDAMGLPPGTRLTFTDAAKAAALGLKPDSAPETIELAGFSRGTAFAIVLAQFGLGFRPVPNAAGGFDLEIDIGDETSNLWPIGWKTQDSPGKALPTWIKSIPVDLDEVEIRTIAQAFADRLEIPLHISTLELNRAGIDIDTVTYTYRNARLSPFRLFNSMGSKLELGFDLRVDEAGHLFLWMTTRPQSEAFRRRFEKVPEE